ncbi:uncharacterized protein LOC132309991 [Cornus florida]|uniref:uncharacterized protein LOC132309991 n=1 Tax=Cornus florida TaxID=4283 RepID=UPI00289BF398|nr:uncharacterized protein LOC132309991 [Cornus florida]
MTKRKALSKTGEPVPKVSPESEWRKAPYFGPSDGFWTSTGDVVMEGIDSGVAQLMEKESSIKKGGWEEWTDHIFAHKSYVNWLRQARVARAMRLCRILKVPRDPVGLDLLLSRWYSATHTFITKWGKFTPTLEDVVHLLGLHVIGGEFSMPLKLDEVEQVILEVLEEGLEKMKNYGSFFGSKGGRRKERSEGAGKNMTGAWIRWCQIAVKIASGVALPLGPLFLGTLYHRLDMVAKDCMRSVGRYPIMSYLAIGFLQMFLYKRFPSYGPLPLELGEPEGAQGKRWIGRTWRVPLSNVIDSEPEFVFRLYKDKVARVIDLGDVLKVYNPRRVPRQFGFDQGVPRACDLIEKYEELEETLYRFSVQYDLSEEGIEYVMIPARLRLGDIIEGYQAFREHCVERFKILCLQVPQPCEPAPVYKDDVSLRLLRNGLRGNRSIMAPLASEMGEVTYVAVPEAAMAGIPVNPRASRGHIYYR